ncbi:MAG: M56 family metallopeptidase [Lentimicrobium sp.]|jgi:TonB family protein|nr:M56 family metallopeptidase [Lentimicrobium sp.]
MTPLFLYLIKVSILNALMIGFYLFAIKRGRNFRLMRGVLLAAIILPLVLPLVPGLFIGADGGSSPIYVITLPETAAVTITAAPEGSVWPQLHVIIYVMVVGIMILGAVFSILSVLRRLRGTKIHLTPYGKIYLDNKAVSPFSFFHWVFFPADSLGQPSYDLLLRHEFSHVAHKHSIDRLVSCLFRAFFWFNPFAHINHRLLSEVHEYQADVDAIGALTDLTPYHHLMGSFAGFPEHNSMTNPFSSHLKKRIIMLNNFKQGKISIGRILAGFLVVAGIALFTSMVQPGETSVNQDILGNTQKNQDIIPELIVEMPQTDGDVVPLYPGGEMARIKYFRDNLRYPAEARQNNIQGYVDYTIEIDENGKVTNPKIQKGLGYGCDEEVLRVLEMMPDWKPGTREGKPAKFMLPFSVRFTLSGDARSELPDGQDEENGIYTVVEEVPRFKGGDGARIEYLSNAITYPEKAKKDKVEGTVYVTFVIEKDGAISNVRVLRGIGSGCDEVAVKAVTEMPVWEPGKHRGQPVRVQFTMPLKFTLNSKKEDSPEHWGGINSRDEVFTVVENAPEFPGGDDARSAYLAKAVVYPEAAKKNGIQGTVYVTFVIEKDGKVSGAKVLRGIGGGCDESAVNAVNSMPDWKPGTQRGEPVRVQFTMPVKFSLEKKKEGDQIK